MLCINCRNEVNTGAIVCPYCHTNPIIFGSTPYQGIPIDFGGGGLLGWIGSWFTGSGKKVAENETESTIVPFVGSERRKCKKCNHLTFVEARYCQGCKRTFVD